MSDALVFVVSEETGAISAALDGQFIRNLNTCLLYTSQGFIEDLRTNVGLVRNLARTADVCTQFLPMGGNNGLRCALMFRHGVTDRRLLAEVRQRMDRVKEWPGFMLGEGMLSRVFDQRRYSLFGQTLQTERPDRTAAFLMQGHVVLLLSLIHI